MTIDRSSGNTVVGDNIQYNDAGGVVVTGGRNDLIGSASAGNTISNNGKDGLYVTALRPARKPQATRSKATRATA